MNIGLYFNDRGFENLNLKDPISGNDGVGGTQYCFLMLGDALAKYSNHQVFFYHYHKSNILPDGIRNVIINDQLEIIEMANNDCIDILIFKTEGVTKFVRELRNTTIKCIAWAHNYLWDKELDELYSNPNIKRIVFVGKEQYDRYIDHSAICKATFIYNMFDGRCFRNRSLPDTPAVTYTGSLVKAKGFHILANVWPEVLKAVPNAQLYVIGDGKLYNRNAELGPLGIAEKTYESMFAPYITKNGSVIPSVHFLGTLGKEKTDIYMKTTVGVMNPTGKTETFGLSAVEMEACGIPVVTKAINGLFDTVKNGENGYLVKNKKQLTSKIIDLLLNEETNKRLGNKAKLYADSAFLPEKIVVKWNDLFEDILEERESIYLPPNSNFSNNMKWLRIIIRRLRTWHFPIKSLVEIECFARNLIHR